MESESSRVGEAVGTIIGLEGGSIVVQLEDGGKVKCQGVKRLHRPLGFLTVPVGRRARIRFNSTSNGNAAFLVEVLSD